MGVIYKLKDEVVNFIISQRQSNPLFSCRQLAESASAKFGLRLSKSSVHDVLKESGIVTPRGRKPKDKFEIPHEKKKQIQQSLSQIKLLPDPASMELVSAETPIALSPPVIPVSLPEAEESVPMVVEEISRKVSQSEISSEYEGAGKIFLKAALLDLGILSTENIKESDWPYYLTYTKGIKIFLENNQEIFIDLPLPMERCIKEAADGLINNTRPMIVQNIANKSLFKAVMEGQNGCKMTKIAIVDHIDHEILELSIIMEKIRRFVIKDVLFMESKEKSIQDRAKSLFFSQDIVNNELIENIFSLKGFDTTNAGEITVTLLIENNYSNKAMLQEAAQRLNAMCLWDEHNRLLSVKIEHIS